eukprot:scaffold9414_cov156-Isochrysis_galbana.AAC.2
MAVLVPVRRFDSIAGVDRPRDGIIRLDAVQKGLHVDQVISRREDHECRLELMLVEEDAMSKPPKELFLRQPVHAAHCGPLSFSAARTVVARETDFRKAPRHTIPRRASFRLPPCVKIHPRALRQSDSSAAASPTAPRPAKYAPQPVN